MLRPGHPGRGRHDGEAGFSLIALLVVLLALAVMAAIAVAVVNSEQSSVSSVSDVVPGGAATPGSSASLADRAACRASAGAIQSAALAYWAGHGATWPADIAALTDATPPYLRTAPDPKWGLVYDNMTGQVDATACSNL